MSHHVSSFTLDPHSTYEELDLREKETVDKLVAREMRGIPCYCKSCTEADTYCVLRSAEFKRIVVRILRERGHEVGWKQRFGF